MRLIALSIVVLSGALMAGAGVLAEALPDARRYNSLELFGLLLCAFGCVLLVVEWWSGLRWAQAEPRDRAPTAQGGDASGRTPPEADSGVHFGQ
jgi:hypothetical protein